MTNIRVLIVDDNSMVRRLLCAILEQESDIDVVGEAHDGRQAVEMSKRLKPNVITMDLEMPVMGGMEAIETIMGSKAVPILVVSDMANAQIAVEALTLGALDVLPKPDCTEGKVKEFTDRVRLLAGVSVVTRRQLRPELSTTSSVSRASATVGKPVSGLESELYSGHVFAIACSTGGPQALAKILSELPADFPCPVLISQHIADGFAGGMVKWLGKLCKLSVRLAVDGDPLQAGKVLVSPSESHFALTAKHRVVLLPVNPNDTYHPSCDVLLDSVAKVFGSLAVGIILTGMGMDGVAGIAKIHRTQGRTIAQNEASSLIYGMNRAAIESGTVQQVLTLEDIVPAMLDIAHSRSSYDA